MHLADRLRDIEVPGKPAPPENWHITLRFLGRVGEVTLERLLAELDQSDLGAPFKLRLGGLGAFPRPARATVLWVGLDGDVERLVEVATMADDAAMAAGVEPEDRPFHSHLTLSRIRPQLDVRGLVATTDDIGGSWTVEEVVVFESDLSGPGPARYLPIERFRLTT